MLNVATGTKWVLGNWKMNGRLASNQALLAALLTDAQVNVAHVGLAVPTVYMAQVAQTLSGQPMAWGGQAVSRFAADGAYTGEVSAAMLADLGASFTLVGHSERRQYFAESDEVLSAQICHAREAGLLPVVCVGEGLAAREAGEHEAVVAAQIDGVIAALQGSERVVVAYEPVWAIGTGLTASLGQIVAMHEKIRACLLEKLASSCTILVLYGGSVKADNAADILALSEVDGVLVGGASLVAEQFKNVCYGAAK